MEILREAVGEMAVWIGEPKGHAVVTRVEVAVRVIARGHDREGLVVVAVVVQVQRSRETGEAEARRVLNSETAVEAAREAAAVEVVNEAEAGVGVGAPRTGAVPGAVEVEEVPMSAEAAEVATLRATSARSTQTQS